MRREKTLSLSIKLPIVFCLLLSQALNAQAPLPTPITSPTPKASSGIEIIPENISKKIVPSTNPPESLEETSKTNNLLFQLVNDTSWFDLNSLSTTSNELCTNLNQVELGKHPKLLSNVKSLNQEFIQVLKKNDIKTLSKLFHSRLNIDFKKIDEMNIIIRQSIGKPTDFSIFKTWLINNPTLNGNSIGCDNEEYSVHKQLGYSSQLSSWIQVSGEKDIGRIFISWVLDKEKRLRIGSWHYQRWTHNHLDPEAWIKKAETYLNEKNSLMAILALDLSLKLLDYKHFLKIQLSEKVNNLLSSSGGMKRFQDAILKLLAKDAVFRTKSLLAPEGLGFQIDFQFKQDVSLNERTSLCKQALKKIISDKDLGLSELDGARCSYYFPKDSIEGESKTGGRYFKKSEII